MKKILITGKEGQVGWELVRALSPLGKIWAFERSKLDLQNKEMICKVMREIKPDIVINAAAYTAVDKAEQETDIAYAVNAVAPYILAEEAKKCGASLIHYSTDYVFDGSADIPYRENDLPNPLNTYGKTKLAGELAIQSMINKYLILRTSWVYGTRGKNFLLTMLRLGKEKERLKVVNDQFGAPTWSRLIAEMTASIIDRATCFQDKKEVWGTYHLTCAGEGSWFNFAEEIFSSCQQIAGEKIDKIRYPKIDPIPTSDYPTPAKRPHFSVLSNEKLKHTLGLAMPHWKEALHLCMNSELMNLREYMYHE